MDFDIIILGGGPGGYIAAERAAQGGRSVALIEKDHLGGTCLNWGCIPTKTLLASAKAYYSATHSEAFGVTVKGSAFNAKIAFDRKDKIVEQLRNGISGLMKKHKVEVILGRGTLASKNAVIVGDREYSATNIIIATGASSAKPPIVGIDSANVFDSTQVLGSPNIPSDIVIIGGGIIGVEFACFYGSLGAKVTIIEMLPEICPSVDVDITKMLRQELQRKNITFVLGAKVQSIENNTVSYELNGRHQAIATQLVLVATGRIPNIADIGLDQVGVHYDKTGIKVDAQCRTNIPNIFAIGDCNGMMQLAHVAARQGEVAINVISGKIDQMRYKAIPAVIYSSPEVATIGVTEGQAKNMGIECTVSKLPLSLSGRFLAENDSARGMVKVVIDKSSGVLLGVHMIGNLSSEIIGGVASLIEAEYRVKEIKELVYPHPTVSELIKDAMF